MCAGLAHSYPLLLKNLQNPNRSWLSVLLGLKQISVGRSVGASFDGWRMCNVCCGNIATAAESSLLSVLFANYEGIRQRKGQSSLADAQGKRQTAQAHWPAPYLMLYSNGSTMRRAFTKPSFWVCSRSFSRVQVTF